MLTPEESGRIRLGIYPSQRRQLELLVQERGGGRMVDPPVYLAPETIQLLEAVRVRGKVKLRVCTTCSRASLTGGAVKRCRLCNSSGQLVTVALAYLSR